MKSTHAPLFAAVAFLLLPASGLALGCDRPGTPDVARETQTTGAKQPTTNVDTVKDAPSTFYGKRITLTGEVESVSNDARSFKLEGNEWIFPSEIRVITKSPVKLGGGILEDDRNVVVTGTLKRFDAAEIKRDVGWDLAPEMEAELRDKPVLVADEIRGIEPATSWTEKRPQGELIGITMLFTVTPESVVGQTITLDRVKVQSVSGKGIFVGPSHTQQTFVLPTGGADLAGTKAGDVIDVRGTVKKTPPADQAIKDWSLPGTLKSVVAGEPLYVEASTIKQASAGKQPQQKSGATSPNQAK